MAIRAVVLTVVAAGGGVLAVAGDSRGGESAAPLPAVREAKLAPAARAAGCVVRKHRTEGREHTVERVRYRTNPPTSGDHDPQPSEDGVYDTGNPPDVEQSVHALEHGRIALQYRRGTRASRIRQLETLFEEPVKGTSGYHTLLFQNQTRMRPAVAVTAWGRSLTCRRFNDRVFDALRAFRRARVDQGPEFIP